ncbi:MAG: hypothetical protein OMOMHJEC_03226 [Xanthomonadales bacterium]|nr:hypothetical protein [Xanthomonadales bacterium]
MATLHAMTIGLELPWPGAEAYCAHPPPGVAPMPMSSLPLRLCGALLLALGAQAHAANIDPTVETALKADGSARVLVRLRDQADLSAAARIEDWEERGWAVYHALHGTAQSSQDALLARMQARLGPGRTDSAKRFWIVNLIALDADRATVDALAADPAVAAILPPLKLEEPVLVPEAPAAAPTAIEWGVTKIRAPEVWSGYGATGVGSVVANVDTGVQFNHPALVNQYRGNLGGGVFDHDYDWFDPTGALSAPGDSNGHGTHVMGTEVGDDGAGNQIGVAPGAKWMAAFGCCPTNEALLAAQQFILAPTNRAGANPDPALRPHVVNQSWGGPGGSQIFEDAIAALRAAGVFPAFSAGNNGGTGADGCGRLGSPGDNPSAFNVGSTDINDNISGSSSRGPNPITGEIGPEVSAPGVGVRSSVPTNSYANLSGTSMASPHVAGAVALLIDVEPKLAGRVAELEELLRKTAVPRNVAQTCGGVNAGTAVPNNTFGWGRIDVKAAADMVAQGGWIEGLVTVGGAPQAGATVSFTRLGKTLTTLSDSEGRYRVVAGAGMWSMSASHLGQTVNAASVGVTQDATTTQDFAIPAAGFFTFNGQIQPAAPAMVYIVDHESLPPVWADAGGSFSIQVPAGSSSLRFVHPGFVTSELTASGSAGGVVSQIIPLASRANYQCLDSTDAGGPTYAWIDATSGTAFPLDDDATSGNITLPGTFAWFGNDFTTVRINSNGFLYFGTTSYTTGNMALPFEGRPNNDAMGLGEDLNPEGGSQGTIHAQTRGNELVVQFTGVQHWASGFPETFQMILDTAADTITYQYHTLSWPDFTTVGVENSTGSAGQLYSYRNSANLVAGRAVRFTPATGAAVNWGCDHAFVLTVSDGVDPVAQGSTITYRLRFDTVGFGGARDAVVTATVPAGTTFVDAAGGVLPNAGTLSWNLGHLRPQSGGALWFRVTADALGGTATNVAIGDTTGESRAAVEQTTIVAPPDGVFADGFE